MGILDVLGHRHGTDKASGSHDYLDFYERFLDRMRNEPITLLEIGVGNGNSLRMWRDYFLRGRIIGLDIEPSRTEFAGDRMTIEIGDQGSPDVMDRLVRGYGQFDVVVDDGGHNEGHQIFSYRSLVPHLKPSGLYILEDVGGQSAVDFLCRIASGIIRGQDEESLAGLCESISFYRETTVTRVK